MNPRRRRIARHRRKLRRQRFTWVPKKPSLKLYDASQVVIILKDVEGKEIARLSGLDAIEGDFVVVDPEPFEVGQAPLPREWRLSAKCVELVTP